MKLKLLVIGLLASVAIALPSYAATPGISGSVHDFTSNTNFWLAGATNTWVKYNNMCGVCHTIHHANSDRLAPLWIHDSTTTSFTPYTSETLDADTSAGPGGRSKACLSCHDGSIGVNQIGGSTVGGTAIKIASTDTAAIGAGGDLTTTHPISFDYAAAATADGFIHDKDATTVFGSGGKTIAQFMLFDGKMECSSCHDIHRQKGSSMTSGVFTKVGGAGARPSELCLTCHIK